MSIKKRFDLFNNKGNTELRNNLINSDSQNFKINFKSHSVKKFTMLCNYSKPLSSSQKTSVFLTTEKMEFYLTSKQNLNKFNFDPTLSQSTKFINFLQYLFYKELDTKEVDLKTYSKFTSSQTIYKKTNNFKLNKKNNFFPYRKAWISYWLLPLMGFLSSFSNINEKQYSFSFSQIQNSTKIVNNWLEVQDQKSNKICTSFDNSFLFSISDIENKKELTPFEILRKSTHSDSALLKVVEEYFNVWIENSSFLNSSLISKPGLSNFSNLQLNNERQCNFLELAEPTLLSGAKPHLECFSKNQDIKSITYKWGFANPLLNSFFSIEENPNYPVKYYHLPLYKKNVKKSYFLNSQTDQLRNSQNFNNFELLNTLVNTYKKSTKNNLNSKKVTFLKKTTYKTVPFSLELIPFPIQISNNNNNFIRDSLIGIHLKETTFKLSFNNFKVKNEISFFENQKTSKWGKANSKKIKSSFIKNPLKDYKKASLILDNFYRELDSLQNFHFNNFLQKTTHIDTKKLFDNNKLLVTCFTESLDNNNLQFYYPSSYNKLVKKHFLLSSVNQEIKKINPNFLSSIFNLKINTEDSTESQIISLKESWNLHRKNMKFLDKLINYFNSNQIEHSINDFSLFQDQKLSSSVFSETYDNSVDSFKFSKKLTKQQLYFLIFESFNNIVKNKFDFQNQNVSTQISKFNHDQEIMLKFHKLKQEPKILFLDPKIDNKNTNVLKLKHSLLFTNNNQKFIQELQNKTETISTEILPSLKTSDSKTKIESNIEYNTNLTQHTTNHSDLISHKKINKTVFKLTNPFLNNQTKPFLDYNNEFTKNEYSSKYINFLSFKLKQFIEKSALKKLGVQSGKLLFNEEQKTQNSLINREIKKNHQRVNKAPLKNEYKIEKIFRSYLSNKHKLRKNSIQKSNNLTNISHGKVKQRFELKNNLSGAKPTLRINFVNSVLKGQLKENVQLQFIPLKSKILFKNSKLNYSFNSLLKKNAFLLKSSLVKPGYFDLSNKLNKRENLEVQMNNEAYFAKLEKSKYLQKKYRRKKLRKETRRRKKRKRFYPRPTWIRFKMYTNLLQNLSSPKKLNIKEFNNLSGAKPHLKELALPTLRNSTLNLVQNLNLYSTKEFYQLKISVLGELKRSFWKSYWLRSNLKPYLNRIKSDLHEIKEIRMKQTFDLNVTNLLSFILGFKQNNDLIGVQKISYDNSINFFSEQNQKFSKVQSASSSTQWQLITQIAEHNRIIYDRIQNLILNIRENLALNGQFKARSYKDLSRQKLKSLISLKQSTLNNSNNDFWVKLEKNKVLHSLFHNSYKYYGSFSNYRLLWSINKSNLGKFKSTNKVKDLWMTTKNRDQSKANKTKKILYQMSQNSKLLLEHSNIKHQNFNLSQATLKNGQNDSQSIFNLFYLEPPIKQNSLTKEEISGNISFFDSMSSIEKLLKISERKLKQKHQKLQLTLGIFNSTNHLNLSIPSGNTSKWSKAPLNQISSIQLKTSNIQNGNGSVLVPTQFKYYTNEYNYWWNESKIQNIASFKSVESIEKSTLPQWVSTFLFHFCTIISLISISQVRDIIKFSLILISKISKIYFEFIYLNFNSVIELSKKLIPTNVLQSNFRKMNQSFYKNSQSKFIFERFAKANPYKMNLTKLNALKKESIIQISTLEKNSNLDIPNIIINNQMVRKLSKSNFSQLNTKLLRVGKANSSKWGFAPLRSRTNLYLSILSMLKKLFMIFQPFNNVNTNLKLLQLKNPQKSNRLNSTVLKFKLTEIIIKLITYSSLNSLLFSLKSFSFLTYSYFVKSINIVETFIRSVYTFFEKPGELIIDWMAYLFLVEWASDLTTTIPDTVDTSFSQSITKYSRSIRFPVISTMNLTSNLITNIPNGFSSFILVPNVSSLFSLNLTSNIIPFSFLSMNILGANLIQRRILSLYEMFLTIVCRPDTDLLLRQQKGHVFWDSWSDLLIEVAEKSNINISELGNLKEEQNRLLEQLLVATKSNNFTTGRIFQSKESPIIKQSLRTQKNLNLFSEILFRPLESNRFDLETNNLNLLLDSQNLSLWKRWSTNQFLSYQGKDTELFIDLHPPKSFSHLTSIKYSQSIQQPIGLILCQIFSGIFYKQIAKNLLVVGPTGNEKSMIIQAIAGETELKIITDNAYRYAMVFRGVAVGIKLLRDVFEALTLHTPCIFLLEDIHAIGERRPLLISDDENTKGAESSFSSEREEVHEKNQVVYQLTKHIISHYKKPYKGDFSLLIPTNYFCFDLYNRLAFNEKQSQNNFSPISPILLTNKTTTDLVETSKDKQKKQTLGSSEKTSYSLISKNLTSSLQIQKNQLLAPPATSPFSVLVLKEEKKFKPKKLVKELPWAGLPGEQFANISKSTYSIRVKIALLADSVLSNLSVKLDMITDLLVIIDSVKGNRGFVVFATTHVPYILDPALRRPGRFDETLSLPQIPNLLSRWEVLNSNLSICHTSNLTPNIVKNNSFSSITKNSWRTNQTNSLNSQSLSLALNFGEPFSVYPIGVSLSTFENNRIKNILNENNDLFAFNSNRHGNILTINNFSLSQKQHKLEDSILVDKNSLFNLESMEKKFLQIKGKQVKQGKLNQINLQKIYSIVSQILLSLQYSLTGKTRIQSKEWGDFSLSLGTVNYSSSNQGLSNLFFSTINHLINFDSLVYISLYSSPQIFKQHLTILIAGQIGQTFARSFGIQKKNFKLSSTMPKNYLLKGLDPPITSTLKTATSLVYAFIQKRIIYQKKLIVPQFLNFGSEGSKTDVPNPPTSNILLPAKRYENFKRTFTVSQLKFKTQLSIGERIQIHQQQRLVKRLYKVPLKDYFRSEILNTFKDSLSFDEPNLNNITTFSNASIILAPLEKSLTKPTSMNWYFRNRILNRHKTYLSNQWWNAQLQEHNTESTFLSDIDWRYSYFITKSTDGNIGDLFIDFPDSEQYYNPKNQRWINTSGSWDSLFDIEKNVYNHSSDHYIYECLMDAFKYLDKNREVLDFYVINIFETGINTNTNFKDIEILEIFKRFSGFSQF